MHSRWFFVRTSDESVKCGQVLGDHPGDFSSETRIDKSCDQTHLPHALRIRATEGISDVDLEVCSHPLWKRFVKKLTPTDKNILAICVCHCSCFFCDEPHARAKHLFVNCSKFEKLRLQLQVQFNVPSSWWEKTASLYQQKQLGYLWLLYRPWIPGLTCNRSQHPWHPYCQHFWRKNSMRPLVLSATWTKTLKFQLHSLVDCRAAIAFHNFRLLRLLHMFWRGLKSLGAFSACYLHLNPWGIRLLLARLVQKYNK